MLKENNIQKPEKGYYYHYKHNDKDINNYAYEVVGFGLHSEGGHQEEDILVAYRPLYEEALVYKMGKMYDLRPLAMFIENVTKEGKTFKRFQKITDEKIISQLEEIKRKMYGSF